ncbi:hypothetical protein L2Y96_09185 [Luteibacter aegosomaticola]|uniref:hypothetical protein n=1 Tax=Luteibacter aegosomaticola TaxID=2911538 RepID=UPI001FF853A4|nr:hypothetical protein [Luteibacter aegosomaticola]UPG91922.1 hypothetical protein L2Y96_09185 [Luteibacter aegosomaticola]
MNFTVHHAPASPDSASEIAPDTPASQYVALEMRVSRLETAMEFIREDIRNLRLELKDLRAEFRVEIRELRTDFRFLLGTLITFGLGLAGMMAKGFHWI